MQYPQSCISPNNTVQLKTQLFLLFLRVACLCICIWLFVFVFAFAFACVCIFIELHVVCVISPYTRNLVLSTTSYVV